MDQLGLFGAEEPAAAPVVNVEATGVSTPALKPETSLVPSWAVVVDCWMRTDPLTGEERVTVDRQPDGCRYRPAKMWVWSNWELTTLGDGHVAFRNKERPREVLSAYGMVCDWKGKVIA